MHPNSLANLTPPWPKGVSGNAGGQKQPVITPAMRRYAEYSYTQLDELAHSAAADALPIKDVIAITALLKAAREVAFGDTARQFVADRLDGKAQGVEVDVAVGVQIETVYVSTPRPQA